MKLVISLLLLLIAFANASDFSGNIKSYPILREPLYGDSQKSLQNSLKLQYSNTFYQNIKTEISYELTSVLAKHTPHLIPSPSYRFDDLKTYLKDVQTSAHYEMNLSQNLNRFNASWSHANIDITLGRQPIAFGSAKSINPTDVLTPFSITSIDKEDRTGVDAINIKTPINSTSLVEAGFVAGENLNEEKNAYYIRPKFNFFNFDLSLTAMNFKKRKLYGIDLQHPIMDAGSWIEIGFVDEFNNALKDYVRITTGIEYKFQSSLYLALEEHYNGASIDNKRINPSEFIFLRNFNYTIISSSYELTPLTIGSIQSYYNWFDQSVFSILKLDYNLSENSYLGLGTFMGVGKKSTSEFARFGKVYFTSFRYYF